MHVLEDDVSKLDWRVPSEVLVLRKVECIAYFHWTYFFLLRQAYGSTDSVLHGK